jgi:hypothetical protein
MAVSSRYVFLILPPARRALHRSVNGINFNTIEMRATRRVLPRELPTRGLVGYACGGDKEGPSMFRIAIALVFALGLAACDAVNTVSEGMNHAKAVESDLETSTGVRPQVGFNWSNGRLVSVTVRYPRLLESKPLGELATAIRTAIGKEFKQKPDNIVLAFALSD